MQASEIEPKPGPILLIWQKPSDDPKENWNLSRLYCNMEMMAKEAFTPSPIPCSRTCPAATCSRARRSGRPSAHPSTRLMQARSSTWSSQNATYCSRIGSGCWSSPFGKSSKRVCCSCWDCTDCRGCSRSCTTRGWVHMTTVGCGRWLAGWPAEMASSRSTSLTRAAWDCRQSVLDASWCWDMMSDAPTDSLTRLWDYRSQMMHQSRAWCPWIRCRAADCRVQSSRCDGGRAAPFYKSH